jgi:hypothetical protein
VDVVGVKVDVGNMVSGVVPLVGVVVTGVDVGEVEGGAVEAPVVAR